MLRDRFWNYLWNSLPENKYRVFLDPMRINFFDTSVQDERTTFWTASFSQYKFHDYGDANSKVASFLSCYASAMRCPALTEHVLLSGGLPDHYRRDLPAQCDATGLQ